jgi:hypothetical protein
VTNDDIRRIASEIKRELQVEYRILIDGIRRIEHKVEKLDDDVEALQNDKIARETREDERVRASRQAAELVATKAAKAIADRERSRLWWLKVVGAVTAAIVAITTLTSVLGQYLHGAGTGP